MWSCGCSSGEEVWSLKFLVHRFLNQGVASELTDSGANVQVEFIGTDYNSKMVDRARSGTYTMTEESLKRLPRDWHSEVLDISVDKGHCVISVKPPIRDNVTFLVQDVREDMPEGPFHLICCRHSVFMYFDYANRATVL